MRRKLSWLKSKERKKGKEKIHRLFGRPRRPLSGGFAILISFTLGLLALNWPPDPLVLLLLGLVWFFGIIGLLDDLQKIGGRGLSEREKLALQGVAALGFSLLLVHPAGIGGIRFGAVQLPFLQAPIDIGLFYPFLGMFVIVATSNAVNLSDGMDGLAAGLVVIACCFMLVFCGLLQKPLAIGVFLSLMAASLGFLIFNYPPARLLMGDMGSLALGAALGAGAMLLGVETFLPLVGAAFVIITLSVILQVGTVRGLWRLVRFPRHGSTESFRPFLCTPLHHHFQWLGWPEKHILLLFWGLAATFGVLALLGFFWGIVWVVGILLLALPLFYAAAQKLMRGSFFIGSISDEDSVRLALFQGLPLEVVGRKLYRLMRRTPLTESTLRPGVAEGLLWRPMTEFEARVALGSLFLQQHLDDEALAEWEQIPVRNLLLRESVVLQLARLYYSHDRLLEAIRLWEALPRTQLISRPNLQEIIRTARLRLAELASKSFRQCMNAFAHIDDSEAPDPDDLARRLAVSLRFNRNLLTLLIDSTGGPNNAVDSQTAQVRSRRRAEKVLQERIRTLERAYERCKQARRQSLLAAGKKSSSSSHLAQQVEEWLEFDLSEVEAALSEERNAQVKIKTFRPSPRASRNAVARMDLAWEPKGAGPAKVVAKSYLEGRVAFFSACYRRERALLGMLSDYGCPVPVPCGGIAKQDRALLLMEARGTQILAERLEGLDLKGRVQLLAAALGCLATLHRLTSFHLQELEREVRSIDKEALVPQYHLSAFRIAIERLFGAPQRDNEQAKMEEMISQYQTVARLLTNRPETFIHFEFTPQHLLLDDSGLTIFDFEQATIGPPEFDLACLLSSVEADLPLDSIRALTEIYEEKSGLRIDARALDYAILAKSLTYAGAAVNFHRKFGGDYHLQRMEWYLQQSLSLMSRHAPLGPLRRLLAPGLEEARRRKSKSASSRQQSPQSINSNSNNTEG